jgi:hypothetical protein
VAQLFSLGIITLMKNTFALLTIILLALCSYGQSQPKYIVLTSRDVDTNSVRLISQPTNLVQGVAFRYVGKTPVQIKAIHDSQPHFKIMRNGVVVAETLGPSSCAGCIDKHTNYVGLVLFFGKYEEGKAAQSALRGG